MIDLGRLSLYGSVFLIDGVGNDPTIFPSPAHGTEPDT
jgi:hypothetical protein